MTDTPAIPPELLQQTAFLRSLARGLLADEQASEDAVQSAWLAALERPRELASPVGWMSRVTGNLARKWRRSETRRARRERAVARPEALPSVSELAEREAMLRAVTEAVLELEEPYRALVLLRYHEGRELREIAEASGEPLATVRSRHARALARLRARLDRTHGGDRRAWALGIARLVGAGRTLAPAGGQAASVTGGAMLMLSKTKLVAAFLVVLGLLALGVGLGPWSNSRGAPPQQAPVRELAAAPGGTTQLVPAADPLAAASRERAGVTRAAPEFGSLSAHVTWSDGTPAEDVRVAVIPRDAAQSLGHELLRTDANGDLHLERVAPGEIGLWADRGGAASASVTAGEEALVVLAIPDGPDVEGRVLDPRGVPAGGAEIWITSPTDTSEGLALTQADAEGRFRLRSVGSGRELEARAPGRGPSAAFLVDGWPDETQACELVLREEGSALALEITGPDGSAVAGALVRLSNRAPGAPLRSRLVSDDLGRCEALGLAPGVTEVVVGSPELAPFGTTVELYPGAGQDLRVTLVSGVAVHGVVRAADGTPVVGASVEVRGSTSEVDGREARSGADGAFRLKGVAAGEIELVATAEQAGRAETNLRAESGAELEWDPVLELGRVLRGRVVDERGLALARWEVVARTGARSPGRPDPFHVSVRSDVEGRFSIANCPDESLTVVVRDPEGQWEFPAAEFAGVEAGPGERELVVADAARASASVHGVILGADGRPAAAEVRLAIPDKDRRSSLQSHGTTGEFEFGLLAPGTYSLEARGVDEARLPPREIRLEAGEHLDLGELSLGARGVLTLSIAGDVSAEDARALSAVIVSSRPGHGIIADAAPLEIEGADLPRELELPCGDYELSIAGMVVAETHAVRIEPGRVSRLELRPRRASYLVLALALPPGTELPLELEIVLRSPAGDEVLRKTQRLERSGPPTSAATKVLLLVPSADEYEVEVIGPAGLDGRAKVGPIGAPDAGKIPSWNVELR